MPSLEEDSEWLKFEEGGLEWGPEVSLLGMVGGPVLWVEGEGRGFDGVGLEEGV